MDFNTLDSYLAPQQVVTYAGSGLIAYAGYVAATDLYHLGFSGYAAIGEAWTTDVDSQKWYAQQKAEHWNTATSNWKRDAAIVVGAGLAGYYCHRYVAPMVGEAARAWDTSVDVMRAANDANLSGRVNTLADILAQAMEKAGKLVDAVDADTLSNDVVALQGTIHKFSGIASYVTTNLESLPGTINATLADVRTITAAAADASQSLQLVPSIVDNLQSTIAKVSQLVDAVKVPWILS